MREHSKRLKKLETMEKKKAKEGESLYHTVKVVAPKVRKSGIISKSIPKLPAVTQDTNEGSSPSVSQGINKPPLLSKATCGPAFFRRKTKHQLPSIFGVRNGSEPAIRPHPVRRQSGL